MGFVDTVKELAEKVGDTVDKGIKTGSDSYKKMTEKSRLKKEISRLNIEINNIFATVGKKLYTDDPDNKEFSKVFESVREKQVEIEELSAQLTALDDKIQCVKCGEMISKDSRFCDKCGAKVGVPHHLSRLPNLKLSLQRKSRYAVTAVPSLSKPESTATSAEQDSTTDTIPPNFSTSPVDAGE